MAERRMFAKTVIDSDAFLEMSVSAQLLYFHLALRADDDGFINKPKSITRMMGCTEDDLRTLVGSGFLILFPSGVAVVCHWKVHNYIRKDAYTETRYKEEKSMLEINENAVYQLRQGCDGDVTGLSTQVRLGKDRLGKDRVDIISDEIVGHKQTRKRFVPPSFEEICDYCAQRGNRVDPQRFLDHYTANGWMVGKAKMKDWKAAVRTWERSGKSQEGSNPFLGLAGGNV